MSGQVDKKINQTEALLIEVLKVCRAKSSVGTHRWHSLKSNIEAHLSDETIDYQKYLKKTIGIREVKSIHETSLNKMGTLVKDLQYKLKKANNLIRKYQQREALVARAIGKGINIRKDIIQ